MKLKNFIFMSTAMIALASGAALPAQAAGLQQFVIERDMAGASKLSAEQLRDASTVSNKVLRELGPDIQWVHSYVAGDKIYCVYNAPSEGLIREHAKRAGLPANKITAVSAVIDPTTAR